MLTNPAAVHRMLRRALFGSPSLSRRRDPGVGRERCDGAGGRVRGGCGSAVSGWGWRARMCSIGRAEAVLHIRPGPVGGGSAESCGNAPAFNAVEILPCAEGPALHMGARSLKTDILEEPRNHAENPESVRGEVALQCAAPPHGSGGATTISRTSPGIASTTARAWRSPSRQAPLPSDEAAPPQPARDDPGDIRPGRPAP